MLELVALVAVKLPDRNLAGQLRAFVRSLPKLGIDEVEDLIDHLIGFHGLISMHGIREQPQRASFFIACFIDLVHEGNRLDVRDNGITKPVQQKRGRELIRYEVDGASVARRQRDSCCS